MRTDIHIYLPGWFPGDEENRMFPGRRHGTDCRAEYRKKEAQSMSITVGV